jgi:hypothetical protein
MIACKILGPRGRKSNLSNRGWIDFLETTGEMMAFYPAGCVGFLMQGHKKRQFEDCLF